MDTTRGWRTLQGVAEHLELGEHLKGLEDISKGSRTSQGVIGYFEGFENISRGCSTSEGVGGHPKGLEDM